MAMGIDFLEARKHRGTVPWYVKDGAYVMGLSTVRIVFKSGGCRYLAGLAVQYHFLPSCRVPWSTVEYELSMSNQVAYAMSMPQEPAV
jgi:hypothetical protein